MRQHNLALLGEQTIIQAMMSTKLASEVQNRSLALEGSWVGISRFISSQYP